MGNAPIYISVKGHEQLRRLSKDLRWAANGKQLRKELRQEIRRAGQPVVGEIRQAVMSVDVTTVTQSTDTRPDRGPQSTGLRAAIARATTLSITAKGIRFKVSNAKLARTHNPRLARYMDVKFAKPWRHPLFGDREHWYEQRGQEYFGRTILRHRREFRAAVLRAMETIAQDIRR